jgi:transcriptional regulator with XRE-family HTH domain
MRRSQAWNGPARQTPTDDWSGRGTLDEATVFRPYCWRRHQHTIVCVEQQRETDHVCSRNQLTAAVVEKRDEVARMASSSGPATLDALRWPNAIPSLAALALSNGDFSRARPLIHCVYLPRRRGNMLSEALRLIRVFHDMSQTELSRKLNLSKSYLSEIENGRKTPTIEIIEKYASTFQIPASSILFFSERLSDDRRSSVTRQAIASKVLDFLRLVERKTGRHEPKSKASR